MFFKKFRTIYKAQDYLYKVEGEFTVTKCKKCGLWYQNPRPVEMELQNLYPEEYLPHQNQARNESSVNVDQKPAVRIKSLMWALLGFTKRRKKVNNLEPMSISSGKDDLK